MPSISALKETLRQKEKLRQAQRRRHQENVAAGRCCSAHHFGCGEKRPHAHLEDGDIQLSKVK